MEIDQDGQKRSSPDHTTRHSVLSQSMSLSCSPNTHCMNTTADNEVFSDSQLNTIESYPWSCESSKEREGDIIREDKKGNNNTNLNSNNNSQYKNMKAIEEMIEETECDEQQRLLIKQLVMTATDRFIEEFS